MTGLKRRTKMLDPTDLTPDLYNDYLHFYLDLNEINYSGDRPHLTCEDVLDAHYLICNHFLRKGEGIGGFGPRDFGLLSSAVARQIASAGGAFVYDDFWEIVSSLIFGLVNDHPFHDANKRTAFLSSIFFMLEQDYTPSQDIVCVEDFMVEIAEHNSIYGRHMEIHEIAYKFKKLFRKNDNRISYVVTFNELRQLLTSHNCSIDNPSGNYINVYKNDTRVAQIGFQAGQRKSVVTLFRQCARLPAS